MKKILCSLMVCSLWLSACSKHQERSSEEYATLLMQQNETSSSWNSVKSSLAALPSSVQEKFSKDFFPSLSSQLEASPKDKKWMKSLFTQLANKPKSLPHIPELFLSMQQKNPVDGTWTSYELFLPKVMKKSHPLLIFLGKKEEFPKDMNQVPAVLAFIPSRQGMSYRLLAEGDFLQSIKDIHSLYPQLQKSPIYLVGQGDHADSALTLANSHFSLIEGLAFSGGKLGLELKNLDLMPITHFTSPHALSSSPWGGKKLIQTLQKRGNARAKSSSRTLSWVLNELIHSRKEFQSTGAYTFDDYAFSQVNPYLQVIAKKSEFDPVKVALSIEEDILHIEGFNIASCKVHRFHPQFPSSRVQRIRLNHHLFTFPQNRETLYVGSNSIEPTWNHKSLYPSGFANYFRQDPLYVVYQSEGASPLFLKEAKEIATRLSSLRIVGYPQVESHIPLLTLQEYRERSLPDHRAIIIAQEDEGRKVLQVSRDYLPLTHQNQALNIFEKQLFEGEDEYAYGLIYPPEAKGSLKQALLLAANDAKGLEALKNHFTLATAFENSSDLILWRKKQAESQYSRVYETTFNDSWLPSYRSKTLLTTPRLKEKVWKFYLKKLLTNSSETSNLILPPLVDSFISVPQQLSFKSLQDFVPDKYFAKIKISSWKSTHLLNKLLSEMKGPVYLSMGDLLEFDSQTQKPKFNNKVIKSKKRIAFLIEARQLQVLSQEDLDNLDYEILPYSLQETLMEKILSDKANMGRELLTLSNKFYPDDKQIGEFIENTQEWEF